MNRMLCLLAVILACGVIPGAAQSMGTLTENGVSMEVKGAVALFDASKPSLRFVLLPFQPTAEDIAKLQAKDPFWLMNKKSPDTKRWADWCPFGWFELSWSSEKQSLGDAKKATIYVYGNGVGVRGSNLNVNKSGAGMTVSVTGAVKEGQEVTLASAGSDTLDKSSLSWNLKVKAKVVPLKQ